MKLSKIYANKEEIFPSVCFNEGLNIIIGEIKFPKDDTKNSHNLGKTLFGNMIDFCLLKGKSAEQFLFKYDVFEDFVFFLEIQLHDGSFITIRRGVKNNTKISIQKHIKKFQNFVGLKDEEWSHKDFPSLSKAKEMLDSFFNLTLIKPWSFRTAVGYALRDEFDYRDVFRLRNAHHDKDWKPYIAHILGLDAKLVKQQYQIKTDYDKAKKKRKEKGLELSSFVDNYDELEGLILLKKANITDIKKQLDAFNFKIDDAQVNTDLVEKIDTKLSNLNKNRYYLSHAKEKITSSLEKQKIIFSSKNAKSIFEESGILFEGQIQKTYDELIQFNREITKERQKYLKKELEELSRNLKKIEYEINLNNNKRVEALEYLQGSDVFEKYKTLSSKLIEQEATLLALKEKESLISIFKELQNREEELKHQLEQNKKMLADNVQENNEGNSFYPVIRLRFNDIIKHLLNSDALISVKQNEEGNLNFKADILGSKGVKTSESAGKTYKKLLCMAFDIAINQTYLSENFTHFTFHDGFLEVLDNRKTPLFIDLLREITQDGYQYIGTLIDSDLPNQDSSIFTDDEIILQLHDGGDEGRLFKMPIWQEES